MLKKSLIIVFAVIFIFQFATALETNIKINTLGNHTININFLNPDRATESVISFGSQTLQSGKGELTTTFVSDEEKFDLSVFVMEGTKKLVYREFDGLVNGEDFSLILLPGIPNESMIEFNKDVVEPETVEVIENESVVENVSETEETTEEVVISQENSTEQITGDITNTDSEKSESKSLFSKLFDSDGGSNPYSKFIFYFVITFALLGAAFFLKGTLKKKLFSKKNNSPIPTKKEEEKETPKQEEEKKEEEKENNKEDDKKIKEEDKKEDSKKDGDEDEDTYVKDAESKIQEAETEMRIARDARRLKEDRKRLMKDRDYLKRLKDSRDKEQ